MLSKRQVIVLMLALAIIVLPACGSAATPTQPLQQQTPIAPSLGPTVSPTPALPTIPVVQPTRIPEPTQTPVPSTALPTKTEVAVESIADRTVTPTITPSPTRTEVPVSPTRAPASPTKAPTETPVPTPSIVESGEGQKEDGWHEIVTWGKYKVDLVTDIRLQQAARPISKVVPNTDNYSEEEASRRIVQAVLWEHWKGWQQDDGARASVSFEEFMRRLDAGQDMRYRVSRFSVDPAEITTAVAGMDTNWGVKYFFVSLQQGEKGGGVVRFLFNSDGLGPTKKGSEGLNDTFARSFVRGMDTLWFLSENQQATGSTGSGVGPDIEGEYGYWLLASNDTARAPRNSGPDGRTIDVNNRKVALSVVEPQP
jgi:hypothetical protein